MVYGDSSADGAFIAHGHGVGTYGIRRLSKVSLIINYLI